MNGWRRCCVYIYIYIYTDTHTHTMEYHSAIKKKWNFAICGHMDGPGGHYAKWNKSDRERQILHDYHLYVKSKKYNKLVNIRKKKQTHKYRGQTSGYQWGDRRGEGQYRGRWERGTNYYV